MNAIADSIVYAVAYIHTRDEREELVEEDEDDSAIAHIMAYLSHATPREEDALAAAAERARKEEQSLRHPQQDMIEFLARWTKLCLEWIGMATSVPKLTDRIGPVGAASSKACEAAVAEARSAFPWTI